MVLHSLRLHVRSVIIGVGTSTTGKSADGVPVTFLLSTYFLYLSNRGNGGNRGSRCVCLAFSHGFRCPCFLFSSPSPPISFSAVGVEFQRPLLVPPIGRGSDLVSFRNRARQILFLLVLMSIPPIPP